MRSLLFCLLILPLSVIAHPGIGIVKDSKGNVYYTDLKQVWKIAKNGSKSLVVKNVHTHELYMDAADNLFGEHLWYNGEKINTWGHYVWRLRNNGSLDTVIKPSTGFLTNYSFVRDDAGNMYWVERSAASQFKKKYPGGKIETIAQGNFKDVRWMHATANGIIYFVDYHHLYKLHNGKFILIAKDISKHSTAPITVDGGRHSLFGIWTDKNENVYIADYSAKTVRQISQNGEIKNLVYSTIPWGPTGGLFDVDGNLWLLEASVTNQVRARKIVKIDFGLQKKSLYSNSFFPVLLVTGFLILLGVMTWFIKSVKSFANGVAQI